ncbi:cobalamin-binding protein [Desulfosarcina sp. OttesenSCG-928-A07]|nr:cobalamin-binding protein [Desulfosarcina sp. OttesenSCG-928-G17]MDL2329344.1 cobalamin-binding protein [Desulfosarcina sp. OttesenSCG-928-A07]
MTPLYRHFVLCNLFFGVRPHGPMKWGIVAFLACLVFPVLSPALAGSPSAAAPVSDPIKEHISVSPQPQRIVALAPSITEILFSLGLSHRVVGVTRFSDYPPEATTLPHVGSYVQLDIEKIVSLKPDLCIAIRDGNPESVINRLESINLPVYTVNPQNLSSVMEALLELGRLLDAESQAEKIVSDMQARVETVRRKVATAPKKPGVFFQIGISPIVSVGSHTFINELITLSGGVNLAAGDTPYPRFSREAVIHLKPDILIITSMTRQAVFEAVKREWEQWTAIPAVQNGRIYLVDSNILDRPTPRLVEGLEMLARLIHPERFEPTNGKDR